jgi:hypothetical protein
MLNNQLRSATIRAKGDIELLVIEGGDYKALLKFDHQKDIEHNIEFLRRFPGFAKWGQHSLTRMCEVLQWREAEQVRCYAPSLLINTRLISELLGFVRSVGMTA